jgi:hypothetical protein
MESVNNRFSTFQSQILAIRPTVTDKLSLCPAEVSCRAAPGSLMAAMPPSLDEEKSTLKNGNTGRCHVYTIFINFFSAIRSKRELVRWIPLIKRGPNPPSEPTHTHIPPGVWVKSPTGWCGTLVHTHRTQHALQTSDFDGAGRDGFA